MEKRSGQNRLAPRISAYFRRSWFCSRRLSDFEPGTKIQSDFCHRLKKVKKRPAQIAS
ncbi:hypothetical protein HMPREF9516_01912 [Enterococcus faecalis TX1302]|nr:hypothetical protein HMPREF9516_01912 [Enterococcus faecalis TX1302]